MRRLVLILTAFIFSKPFAWSYVTGNGGPAIYNTDCEGNYECIEQKVDSQYEKMRGLEARVKANPVGTLSSNMFAEAQSGARTTRDVNVETDSEIQANVQAFNPNLIQGLIQGGAQLSQTFARTNQQTGPQYPPTIKICVATNEKGKCTKEDEYFVIQKDGVTFGFAGEEGGKSALMCKQAKSIEDCQDAYKLTCSADSKGKITKCSDKVMPVGIHTNSAQMNTDGRVIKSLYKNLNGQDYTGGAYSLRYDQNGKLVEVIEDLRQENARVFDIHSDNNGLFDWMEVKYMQSRVKDQNNPDQYRIQTTAINLRYADKIPGFKETMSDWQKTFGTEAIDYLNTSNDWNNKTVMIKFPENENDPPLSIYETNAAGMLNRTPELSSPLVKLGDQQRDVEPIGGFRLVRIQDSQDPNLYTTVQQMVVQKTPGNTTNHVSFGSFGGDRREQMEVTLKNTKSDGLVFSSDLKAGATLYTRSGIDAKNDKESYITYSTEYSANKKPYLLVHSPKEDFLITGSRGQGNYIRMHDNSGVEWKFDNYHSDANSTYILYKNSDGNLGRLPARTQEKGDSKEPAGIPDLEIVLGKVKYSGLVDPRPEFAKKPFTNTIVVHYDKFNPIRPLQEYMQDTSTGLFFKVVTNDKGESVTVSAPSKDVLFGLLSKSLDTVPAPQKKTPPVKKGSKPLKKKA